MMKLLIKEISLLIQVVNNAAKGNLTDDCMALLNSLEIPDNVDFPDFCHLFATNNKCDMYNMQRLYEVSFACLPYFTLFSAVIYFCTMHPYKLFFFTRFQNN